MKITEQHLRKLVRAELLREALAGPPETAEEWMYWGGGHNLNAEEDNDGQTVFYVDSNHPDRSAIIDEAEQTADGVETDNDGQAVIYTGAYNQRDKAMAALKQRYGISSKTTEEFGSSPGGVWINAESDVPLTDDGAPLFDYYIDAHPYMFGVHPDFEAFVIDKLGFAPEWNDPGTLMLWRLQDDYFLACTS